ncbi:MAG TPA: hypothetical protein PKA88_19395 [Polyangiaceae bacterium]|nr:hypothetical protein [Polyangiaceae bacterium]HMR78578.1 hypothetical protein [Polyangiaceae bacterium]
MISPGAVWRYLDTGSAPSDWNQTQFDDSNWKSGPAELGYGDGDETTVVGFGPNENEKFITTYFRHGFELSLKQLTAARLNVLRDDGVVVYVNGTQAFIDNLPEIVTASTPSLTGVSKDAEATFLSADVDPKLFVIGKNVVAVEIHQDGASSTDISFDLKLELDGQR